MTGNEQWNGIPVIHHTYSPDRKRVSCSCRNIPVCNRGSIGNRTQYSQDMLRERCP